MVIVAAIILVGQTTFNGSVLLRGQAYEVALHVREVQLSSVSVSGDTGDFRTRYGVHFNITDPYRFAVYEADTDGFYEGDESLFGPQGILDERFAIDEMRLGAATPDEVSVVFIRPNFDALFYDGVGSLSGDSTLEIDVRRVGTDAADTGCGAVRTVEITSTGQISVQDCP